ncbi:MAG: hypothetical protein IPH96_13200 [Saprospiraceae bacterium]|nr:hypothetical protein [Saprospiraceae bacterium]
MVNSLYKTVPINSAPNQVLTLTNGPTNGDLAGMRINGVPVYWYCSYGCALSDALGTFTFTVQP